MMPSMATIGSNRRPPVRLMLAASFFLLAALAAIFFWLPRRASASPFDVPGSVGLAGSDRPDDLRSYVAGDSVLEDLAAILVQNLDAGFGLVDWYRQENREMVLPTDRSPVLSAENQILHGSWLAEQDRQAAFTAWQKMFETHFVTASGLVIAKRELNGLGQGSSPALLPADPDAGNWPETLKYLRVLAIANSRWPSREIQSTISRTVDSLAIALGEGLSSDSVALIPTPAPTMDPAATPTPLPTATPTPDPLIRRESVIRLDSLDILALQYLGQQDARLESLSSEALDLVEGGLISDTLPLYAFSYAKPDNGSAEEAGGYVRFSGEHPVIALQPALETALHLAEVGRLDPRTLNWLTEHLLNDGALYSAYHIAQGQAISSEESLVGYALTARIARIVGDRRLYDAAANRLQWHLATSQTSQVRGAVFRQTADGLVTMTAEDNLWALLALS